MRRRAGAGDGEDAHRRGQRACARSCAAVASFAEADFEALRGFVATVEAAGCQVAIVHARKAVLGGLSPKDNREVPAAALRRRAPSAAGLPDFAADRQRRTARAATVTAALTWCDGVMLGREAYHRPFLLAELQQQLHPGGAATRSRAAVARAHGRAMPAASSRPATRLSAITRHMLGLYSGRAGRARLSPHA